MEVLCSVYRFPAPCARSVMGLFSSCGHFCGIRPSLLPRQRLQCVSHLPPRGSWLRPPFPRPSFCLQRGFSRCGGRMQSSWLVPRVGRRGALNQKGRGKPLGGGMEEGIRILAVQRDLGQGLPEIILLSLSSLPVAAREALHLGSPLPGFASASLPSPPAGMPCFCRAQQRSGPSSPIPGAQRVTLLPLPGYCPLSFEPGPGAGC